MTIKELVLLKGKQEKKAFQTFNLEYISKYFTKKNKQLLPLSLVPLFELAPSPKATEINM